MWYLVFTVNSTGLSNYHKPALVSWGGGLWAAVTQGWDPRRKNKEQASSSQGQETATSWSSYTYRLQTANPFSSVSCFCQGFCAVKRSTLESGNTRDYSFYEVQLVITSTCDRNQSRRRVGRKAELGGNTRSCVRSWVQSEHMCLSTWSSGRSAWVDSAGLALLDKVWGWVQRTTHSFPVCSPPLLSAAATTVCCLPRCPAITDNVALEP